MFSRGGKAVLVLAAAVLAGSAFAGEKRSEDSSKSLPDGVHGFSGWVNGTVMSKGDKNTFTFKINSIKKIWKNSKAKEPKALLGKTVTIGPRWEKGEGGKWHPSRRHVNFISRLKRKHKLDLEIYNPERDHFAILELSKWQRELADKEQRKRSDDEEREEDRERKEHAREEEKEERERDEHRAREEEKEDRERDEHASEEGGEGRTFKLSKTLAETRFLGVVIGLDGSKLTIRIEKTGRKDKRLPTGRKVAFHAQWEKWDDGRWHPSRREMKAFKSLKAGDRVECGAYFDEHSRLCTIEVAEDE